ncbi:MAG TPA: hypothetical protein VFY29_05045 [Terriglobia bacterium]|nr:hypothetical protein [Terriglobia bacterium]
MTRLTLLLAIVLAQTQEPLPPPTPGAVAGRLFFMNGTPAVGARVAVMPTDSSRAQQALIGVGRTDSDGRYAVEGIPPGRYYLVAGPLDALTYFPGVLDLAGATVVTVNSGARLDVPDFRLAAPDYLKVSGRLTREDDPDTGVGPVEVRLNARLAGLRSQTAMTANDGSFEFPRVPPGDYDVRATTTRSRNNVNIAVRTTDITGLRLTSMPTFRISGRLSVEDNQPVPAGFRQLQAAAASYPFFADIEADGSFVFHNVTAGVYKVSVNAPVALPVVSVTVLDDVTDFVIPIPRAFRFAGRVAVDNGLILAQGASLQLNGSVRGWVPLAADGSFEFLAVMPGKYKAEVVPPPADRMPPMDVEISDRDVTGIVWTVSEPMGMDPQMLLKSRAPLDRAWGGWIAGQMNRRDLLPLLGETLAAQLKGDPRSKQEAVAIDTIVDALIQFGEKLPADLLESLFERRPDQALILLARLGPEADPILFHKLQYAENFYWFAVANLLINHKTPGIGASVLGGLHIKAQFVVCPTERQPCPRSAGMAPLFGDRVVLPLTGFPPWPSYALTVRGEPFADGPVPVFMQRKVESAGGQPEFDDLERFPTPARPTGADRLRYLSALAPQARIQVQEYEERTVYLPDKASPDVDAESFRQDIQARYTRLVEDLVASGVLNPAEAEKLATPKLTFSVIDRRRP